MLRHDTSEEFVRGHISGGFSHRWSLEGVNRTSPGSFIHSFRPFLLRPFKSFTTQRCSRLQHRYRSIAVAVAGVSRRSAQATAGIGLAQGPYVAARAGVEPTTLRLKVIWLYAWCPQVQTCPSF